MAKREPTAKEIRSMAYETRRRMFDQEQRELFQSAKNISLAELAELHRKLVDKWKV